MPHLTLEHTANITQDIDPQTLFSSLHQILAEVGGISIDNCKSRAIPLHSYHIGAGDPDAAFVHLVIRFLKGRSLTLKQEIAQQSIERLSAYFAPSATELALQITVEIVDIQRQTYFKIPKGTLSSNTKKGDKSND